jgi:large subunit ribosomal protein L22
LFVTACFADEGTTMKRFKPRARGRAGRIRKRGSHVTIIVARLDDASLERLRAEREKQQGSRRGRVAGSRAARVAGGRRGQKKDEVSEETTSEETASDESAADETVNETAETATTEAAAPEAEKAEATEEVTSEKEEK